MNINTLYFEKFGRTVSIVTPRNNAEAKHVVTELYVAYPVPTRE